MAAPSPSSLAPPTPSSLAPPTPSFRATPSPSSSERWKMASAHVRARRMSPMIVTARDPYFAQTLDYGIEEEDEDAVSEHSPAESFVYERRRTKHEWNKRGSIVEEIVSERERVAMDSLRKYGRVFGRWQNDARRTYFLPSYIKTRLQTEATRGAGKFEMWASNQLQAWTLKKSRYQEFLLGIELWTKSFKAIEGYFGAGVAAYFVFLKWLFVLNAWTCLFTISFVVLPQVSSTAQETLDKKLVGNISKARIELSTTCSARYTVRVNYIDVPQLTLDLLQGTGWMEQTVMFYGYYGNTLLDNSVAMYPYNMPLAYLVVILVILIFSLVMMVRHTAIGLKSRILEAEDKYFLYGSLVFASWDCSMNDPRTSVLKHRSIYNEIRGELAEQRRLIAIRLQTTKQKIQLILQRIVINIFVVMCLCGAGYMIYFATNMSTHYVSSETYKQQGQIIRLGVQYVPSLTITGLNFVIPFIFRKVVRGEQFSKDNEIQITLFRTVFLRLASLGVLIFTIYTQVSCEHRDKCGVGMGECPSINCWETYVGQQIYKLVVLDFLTVFLTVTMVQFPRTFVVKHFENKITRMVGKPEFQIPKNVLDLVYSQSLCWIGTIFSPMIPLISVFKCFCFFYMKKYTCIYNHEPAAKPYRASKSHAFFMMVLLTTFILICMPVGYIIWSMPPSMGCGPFRLYQTMYEVVLHTIETMPFFFRIMAEFMLSPGFVVPLVTFLCVLSYYFAEISKANNERTAQLKEQLIMEGKDKQYLLSKIDHITGKGQIRTRRHTNAVLMAPVPNELQENSQAMW